MSSSDKAAGSVPINQNVSGIEKLGEILFKARDYTPVPLVILALLFAQPTVESFVVGVVVALVGEFIRTYGVAFIGTISRTRSYSNGELVSSGPFQLLRNPLYFGNLVLSLGLSIMPNLWWLPVLTVVIFYAQYIPIVRWEEMKLQRIFGEKYFEYCRHVPNRWFPRVSKLFGKWYENPESWKPALRSEKRTLTSLFSYTIIMAVLLYLSLEGSDAVPLVQNFLSR